MCTINGLSDGRPLAAKMRSTASVLPASAPSPYTVSVGKATVPPCASTWPASCSACFASFSDPRPSLERELETCHSLVGFDAAFREPCSRCKLRSLSFPFCSIPIPSFLYMKYINIQTRFAYTPKEKALLVLQSRAGSHGNRSRQRESTLLEVVQKFRF